MVKWHHQLNGHGFEQAPGDSEGQGSLVCCSPWGRRVEHDLVTEQQQQDILSALMIECLLCFPNVNDFCALSTHNS